MAARKRKENESFVEYRKSLIDEERYLRERIKKGRLFFNSGLGSTKGSSYRKSSKEEV